MARGLIADKFSSETSHYVEFGANSKVLSKAKWVVIKRHNMYYYYFFGGEGDVVSLLSILVDNQRRYKASDPPLNFTGTSSSFFTQTFFISQLGI